MALALAWALSLASTSLALADAARLAAREIARGVSVQAAVDAAQGSVPGAVVHVESGATMVTVIAERSVSAPVPILRDVVVPLRQAVSVPREWM